MKVSEAKTKVCPFMSGLGSGVSPSGDFLIDFEPVNCVCGDCMAWEYTKTHKDVESMFSVDIEECGCTPQGKYEFKRMNQPHKSKGQIVFFGIELDEDDKVGYCKRLQND